MVQTLFTQCQQMALGLLERCQQQPGPYHTYCSRRGGLINNCIRCVELSSLFFAAVQAGSECRCNSNFGKHGIATKCNTHYNLGDRSLCAEGFANNVYHSTGNKCATNYMGCKKGDVNAKTRRGICMLPPHELVTNPRAASPTWILKWRQCSYTTEDKI
jgi:hypothetical protein